MSKNYIKLKDRKPIYYGYYGNLRGEWLKEHEPELFKALETSGELISYLDGYQQSYVAKARKLRPRLQKKVGLYEGLHNIDYADWLAKQCKVETTIREMLAEEIRQ